MSPSRAEARAAALVLVGLLVAGCQSSGSSSSATADPSSGVTGSFDSITIADGLAAEVRPGETGRAQVSGAGSSEVSMQVSDGVLTISAAKGATTATTKPQVIVETPTLRGVNASSGAAVTLVEGMSLSGRQGDIDLSSAATFKGDVGSRHLDLGAESGAHAELSGTVLSLGLSASESGTVGTREFTASRARMTLSGAAAVELTVRERLVVVADSGAKLTYYGNPSVSKKVSTQAQVARG